MELENSDDSTRKIETSELYDHLMESKKNESKKKCCDSPKKPRVKPLTRGEAPILATLVGTGRQIL
jgi:hypothetical protein